MGGMGSGRKLDPAVARRRKKVIRMWTNGMDKPEIAQRLGLPIHVVRDDLKNSQTDAWHGDLPELTDADREEIRREMKGRAWRCRSPLADAQREAPKLWNKYDDPGFVEKVRKAMKRLGVPTTTRQQWVRGEDL